MPDKLQREWLEAASATLGIQETIIEKDYYVTQTIQALSQLMLDDFTLVFAGGTCLAKGHRIVQRMSEDVDFKVILKDHLLAASMSAQRKKLSELREQIQKALASMGFDCSLASIRSRNNNQYMNIALPYRTLFSSNPYLRPEIQVELTVSSLQLNTVVFPVQTLIAESIPSLQHLPKADVTCVSLTETAAEKWVALTRRMAMHERGHSALDKTLIRHLYDLHYIHSREGLDEKFESLIYTRSKSRRFASPQV